MMRPKSVVILGKTYQIEYCERPSDVDIYKRESLWGQVDYWSRSIRIYSGVPDQEVLQTFIHEVLHAIHDDLQLDCFKEAAGHKDLDRVALALADVLTRNGWVKEGGPDAPTT